MKNSSDLDFSAAALSAAKFFIPAASAVAFAAVAQAQPDYAPAYWRPPGCAKYYTSGNGHNFCVIHDMEGYYWTGISYLNRCDTSAGGSYNVATSVYYAVNSLQNGSDEDGHAEGNPSDPAAGEITQFVRESNYAWHARCWNTWMFGTEHEGFASSPAWYTEAMYQASAGLQRHLCDNYSIPKDRNHIIAHSQKSVSSWVTWMQANWPSIDPSCNTHTDPGQYWDWTHFMDLINNATDNASFVSKNVADGATYSPGQAFSCTWTLNNNGTSTWIPNANHPNYYTFKYASGTQMGAPSSTALTANVAPGANRSFAVSFTTPTTPGTYTVNFRMNNAAGVNFGQQVSLTINVVGPINTTGTSIGSYTIDWTSNPTSASSWAQNTCSGGISQWYTYGVKITGQSCTVYNRNLYWNSAQSWSGRGHFNTDVQVTCSGTALAKYVLLNASNADTATQPTLNQCPLNGWYNILNSDWTDLSINGWRTNPNIADAGSGCSSTCGSPVLAAAGLHMYGARWHYIDDWTCLGGYGSTSVSDTANRSFAWGESGLYLYPAIDTSHGDHITADLGLNGKTPGHINAGDCNNASTLDFKGNASAYGNGDNMDSYAFAWLYSPSGAGPRFLIGSDDGNRVWVNGSLINDTNASRGLTRDMDETGGIALPAGWNRVLFKVHNFTSGFAGTVSLRYGSDRRWNEPSVNVFDLGGYYSYGLGYEQDAWYPGIDVGNCYGAANPQPGANLYGNNTTITATGTAWANGPVPFWRVMHFEWGYGITGDTDYATVSSSGSSWSHTATSVTGHRRFHFFAVSKSGRTSFQNSGGFGGWNWADGGPGNYMDVFIDNVAPLPPAFSSVNVLGPTQVSLAWSIPLDQGVGIDPGDTEAADETIGVGPAGNYYRAGNVGVQVYRNGSAISAWGTATAVNDSGLTANAPYTYTVEARDNSTGTRGSWNNSTGPQGSTTVWTLSAPPAVGAITPGSSFPVVNDVLTWTAVNGFGPGKVQYYRYAWDTSPSHTWTETEPQWSSSTLPTLPTSVGTWYLHVKGYNGVDVGNGTFDYAVTVNLPPSTTVLASSANPSVYGQSVTFTATVAGTNGVATGTVTFKDGTAVLGTGTLDGSAQTTFDANDLSVAGSPHSITAAYGGDSNYSPGTSSPVLQTVTPISLTVSGLSANDRVYDATTNSTLVVSNAALVGLLSGADVSLITSNAVAAFADKNVGANKPVQVNGLALAGADAGNYTLSPPAGLTASITNRPLTVNATAANKSYDGSAAAAVTLFDDKVPGDSVTESYVSAMFDDANAGTGKTVTVTGISTSGADATNYTANATATTTADIAPGVSSTLLTSSLNPAFETSNVTFTATVSAVAPAVGFPVGDVVFLLGSTPFSTNALADGVATTSASSLPVGTDTIAAQYAANGNFLGSSDSLQQVIQSLVTCSQTNALLSITTTPDGTFTLAFTGTPQAEYYIVTQTSLAEPIANWQPLPGSTNKVTNGSGLWYFTVTNNSTQQFYRSVAITPCP